LVVPYVGLAYYNSLAEELQLRADDLGYSVIIAAAGTEERERRVFEQLRRGLVDGVIIRSYFLEQSDLDLLAKSGVAVVAITNSITEASGFDIVRIDDTTACYQAMNYLINKGHRQIAFMGHLADRSMHHGRFEYFRRALEEARIPVNGNLICSDMDTREKAYTTTRALLNGEEKFTAILAASDTIAVSAIWAIRDTGLQVPDDIAVIGFGNHLEGAMMTPSLTTIGAVNQGYEDVADLLFSRLEAEESIPGRIHLRQWEFIERGTA
jgi:LacI family transcriptional regulator